MSPRVDLLAFVADADLLAVMEEVLARPAELGAGAFTFKVDRHTGRDPGMVKDGPELVRMRKAEAERCVLIWDHQGSGWEARHTASESRIRIIDKLERFTWKDCSDALVLEPELEEWLWRDPPSIARHLEVEPANFDAWVDAFAGKQRLSATTAKTTCPKELLYHVFKSRWNRQPRPGDYRAIAKLADLSGWGHSASFSSLLGVLVRWFPK